MIQDKRFKGKKYEWVKNINEIKGIYDNEMLHLMND